MACEVPKSFSPSQLKLRPIQHRPNVLKACGRDLHYLKDSATDEHVSFSEAILCHPMHAEKYYRLAAFNFAQQPVILLIFKPPY